MFFEILGVLAVGGLAYALVKQEKPDTSGDDEREDLHLTQYVTFGDHLYRQKGEVAEVILKNPKKHISRTIIEDNGHIVAFPGFEHPSLIASYLDDTSDRPFVKFRSEFDETDDGFMFRWEIQPDGRYWDDDGFGSTNAAELILYAYLNDRGIFTSKFRIYSYGVTKYFGTDREDIEAQKLESTGKTS